MLGIWRSMFYEICMTECVLCLFDVFECRCEIRRHCSSVRWWRGYLVFRNRAQQTLLSTTCTNISEFLKHSVSVCNKSLPTPVGSPPTVFVLMAFPDFLSFIFLIHNAFSALTLLVGRQEGTILKKTEWWGTGVVICLERGADMHMAQLMPLSLTVSSSNKI